MITRDEIQAIHAELGEAFDGVDVIGDEVTEWCHGHGLDFEALLIVVSHASKRVGEAFGLATPFDNPEAVSETNAAIIEAFLTAFAAGQYRVPDEALPSLDNVLTDEPAARLEASEQDTDEDEDEAPDAR